MRCAGDGCRRLAKWPRGREPTSTKAFPSRRARSVRPSLRFASHRARVRRSSHSPHRTDPAPRDRSAPPDPDPPIVKSARAEHECAITILIFDKLDEPFIRFEARPNVLQSCGPQHGCELRNRHGSRRLRACLCAAAERAIACESLLSARVGPIGTKLVQQPLVSSFQFRSRERAGPDHGRFQIAITQRDGERRFAFDHRLALINRWRTFASALSRSV